MEKGELREKRKGNIREEVVEKRELREKRKHKRGAEGMKETTDERAQEEWKKGLMKGHRRNEN